MKTFWLVMIDGKPRMATEDKRKAEDFAEHFNAFVFSEFNAVVIRAIEASEPKIHLRQLRSRTGLFSDIAPIDAPRVHNKIIIDIPPQFTMADALTLNQEFDAEKELRGEERSRREFRYIKTAYVALHIYED